MAFIILHISLCLVLFVGVFLYSNCTPAKTMDLKKDWELIRFKNILKDNYLLKKNQEFILIRLKYLDNSFLKNSIQIEPFEFHDKKKKLRLSARTDLKPLGFILFLLLTFVFYIGAVYMFILVKKARQRELKEIHFISDLSKMI